MTGLAWTALGGATLDIEASLVHANARRLQLTGNLGEVMRESAEIAYSYISSHLPEFGARPGFFDTSHIHLHVPQGATPKDGPSAGISMARAARYPHLALDICRAPRYGVRHGNPKPRQAYAEYARGA